MPRHWRRKTKKTRRNNRKLKKCRKKIVSRKQESDLGYKKEVYVVNLINKLIPRYWWLIKAKQSVPNGKDDRNGIDVVILTTHGEFYLQIKGTLNAARKFMRCDNHGRHFKIMYVVDSDSDNIKTNSSSCAFNIDFDILPLIIILVIHNNGRCKIEDEEKVLQKIKIALDIIKLHFV